MPESNLPNKESSPNGSSNPIKRKRPVPGRGHSESRKGCSNCKRRRVKCSEELPSCRGCRLSLFQAPPASSATLSLRLEDLRFFHHFLVAAYPSLPFGLDDIWQTVAAMSNEYDFLAHAILGLAAQHLTVCAAANFSVQALDHRVSAITALNRALSNPSLSRHDADAKFATAILLTFQSSYMSDGMMEFLGMLRGWMIIQTTVVPSMEESVFRCLTEDAYASSMKTLMDPAAAVDETAEEELRRALQDFKASLGLVAPLCQSTAELHYRASMERIARLSQTSPVEACRELVPLYAVTNDMDAEEFANFTKLTNFTAQILLAHFRMLTHVLQRHSLNPARAPHTPTNIKTTTTTMETPTPTPILPSPPKCTTAIPDNQGYVPPDACNANYGFYPSWELEPLLRHPLLLHVPPAHDRPAAGLARKWFCWRSALVVVSGLLFLLAPLWINAFVYMVVARLVHFLLPANSQRILGLSPRWLAKAFAAGGGMLAGQDGGETVEMGQRVYMAGIGVQLLFVVLFAARLMKVGMLEIRCDPARIRPLVWSVLAVITLIVVRIVFRFIKFSGGVSASNHILANEAYQLALDALPMLVAIIIINAMHPGKVLKGPESSFPGIWPQRWKLKSRSGSESQGLDSSSVELNDQRRG
ncbi:hypothetical protein C8A00DRAFT_46028 [Chaetomidium leptoderma]|uniref:Zn(2)-C6 fungal-type domain-containing protein n=1 Tax=Chaetomidium leptoderma TaxID=669021 RepID=A0AAN6VG29_9PEZI|nr:hypothetical protein C8A00DRAFT_46028 [Chaetomidium leptoderma]